MTKRNIYNVILGITVGGVLAATTCISGHVVLNIQESALVQEIQDESSHLYEITQTCEIDGFYEHYVESINKLENDRLNGKIDGITYKVNHDYIESNQFKEDYIKNNFPQTYENEILPLREKIENKKEKQEQILKTQTILATTGIAGASIAAYSSAMLFNAKKDAEKEI